MRPGIGRSDSRHPGTGRLFHRTRRGAGRPRGSTGLVSHVALASPGASGLAGTAVSSAARCGDGDGGAAAALNSDPFPGCGVGAEGAAFLIDGRSVGRSIFRLCSVSLCSESDCKPTRPGAQLNYALSPVKRNSCEQIDTISFVC